MGKRFMFREVNDELYREEWRWQEGEYTVTRSTQWSGPGCHNGCGVLFYTDKDGKVVKIEGDPKNPVYNGRLCMRCFAVPEATNHPTRIKHPMKRDPKDRGKDTWEECTWDEAYDIIEREARRIIETYGNKSIVTFSGTGRNATWQGAAINGTVFQSPNLSYGFLSGESCYSPRLAVMACVQGDSAIIDCGQMYEGRYDDPRFVLPEVVMVWGNNALVSNPDGFMGHWIVDMQRRGTKLITVDPRLTWQAARSEYWLRLRPGTDAAVALGMIRVIVKENLWDHDFVNAWCYGFEQLAQAAEPFTPEEVERISGVNADSLVGAARMYATAKPASIQWGLALDQQKHGVGAIHAVNALWAITGNVDNPGGNILCTTGYIQHDVRRALQWTIPDADKRLGNAEYPLHAMGITANTSSDKVLEALETDKPYPIKMIFESSSNYVANMSANPQRTFEACKDVEFFVVTDLFMTPTAMANADIFLPVQMGPERMGVRGWWQPIRAINICSDGGDTRCDEQIILDLGHRLNPEAVPWENVEDFFNSVMDDLQSVDFGEPFSYADLRDRTYRYEDWHYYKYKEGLLRDDGQPGFNTPTGRIELWCTTFQNVGLNPLPYYDEPVPSPLSAPDVASEYPYVLATGRRSWEFFHSEHRQLKSMREFHRWPVVEMNSRVAAENGIKEGDWVLIENYLGQAREVCMINDSMADNVIEAEHGWWFPERDGSADGGYFGVFESNVNCLVPMCDNGPSSFAAPYSTQMCKISKLEGYSPEYNPAW